MYDRLGKYEVHERLGRGGMAEVYRGYHASLDRYVAIKVLHAFLAEDPEFKERFEKEARNIAKLRHPNIVQVYDFDYEPSTDSYYMVMELVDGPTLKDWLFELADEGKKLPIGETLRIIREAASALAYAHSLSMVHRDVKPANLMLDSGLRVILTDFGIAKIMNSGQLTVSGGMIGTPAYMAPEQGLGEAGDERSDIYSLGVIMYQLVVGALPYDAETALGIILKHVNDPVPEITDISPDIPDDIVYIVNRAMTKTPEDRYQTASEMIADLERVERGESISTKTAFASAGAKQQEPVAASVTTNERATAEHAVVPSVEVAPEPAQERSVIPYWLVSILVLGVISFGGYIFVFNGGEMPSVLSALVAQSATATTTPAIMDTAEESDDVVPSETDAPPPTNTSEPTDTVEPTDTEEATATPSDTPSRTPSDTPTPTPSDTPTRTPTETPSRTPTRTDTPAPSLMPSGTPNATQTAGAIETMTVAACVFDYAVIEQTPANGEEGDFFRINEDYLREITLLNTGTCLWGRNTSLTFITGEDFNAGPRIFIREEVLVGDEVVVQFEGRTPPRGSVDPIAGLWQLRTPGQITIGEELEISVMVFDPGSG